MIDCLYNFNIKMSGPMPKRIALWAKICRKLTIFIANYILPIYFLAKRLKSNKIQSQQSEDIIVSLTSFPARISKVWLTIECILNQTLRPYKIVLWLSREQFPNGLNSLPQRLVSQTKKGLDIRFVNGDVRSYKKFYYSFEEFSSFKIVTIDDDLLFPTYFISEMDRLSKKYPKATIANFGFKYCWDENNSIFHIISTSIKREEQGSNLFFGTGGGTLFYPKLLVPYLDPLPIISKICPTADDIYLNALVRLAKQRIVFRQNAPLLSIIYQQNTTLLQENGSISSSDSVNAQQLHAVLKHMKKKWGVNPFYLKEH